MDTVISEKICPKCKRTLPVSVFGKDKNQFDGYTRVCKECIREYNAKYRQQPHAQAYRKQYRKDHYEKDVTRRVEYKDKFYSMTLEDMNKIVEYDKETGAIRRLDTTTKITETKQGYLRISIRGKNLPVHKLAWFLVYGVWVPYIDHINGLKADNRLCNLRECNIWENGCNRVEHRNGKLVGSYYDPRRNLWRSQIQINNKWMGLGNSFQTEYDASLAYCRYVLKHNLVRREFLRVPFTDEELYGEEK